MTNHRSIIPARWPKPISTLPRVAPLKCGCGSVDGRWVSHGFIRPRTSLALLALSVVALAGCGNGPHDVDAVLQSFAAEGIPVEVGREPEGDSVLQAVLDPARTEDEGRFAVDVFASAEAAELFVANVRAGSDRPVLTSRNVVVFYQPPVRPELMHKLKRAIARLHS